MARIGETAGAFGGAILAPVAGAVAWARRARVFHPDGVLSAADVAPAQREAKPAGRRRVDVAAASGDSELIDLGCRLQGRAIVRLSSAVWRGGREWIDVLGCAVRFHGDAAPRADAAAGDQDLLLATIRSPWRTLFAPLTTEQHDFLRNDYYGVSPFAVDGGSRTLKLRAVPIRDERNALAPGGSGPALSRAQRLDLDVRDGRAVLELQARAGRGGYAPVARIALRHRADLDQARLRFSPFRDGRGLRPRGFVHALRLGTYAQSQSARPRCSDEQLPSHLA